VRLRSPFDDAFTGRGQVVIPVRVGGRSTSSREHVDDVRVGVVRQVHHRGDVLVPARPAAVMHEDERVAFERSADPALVRSELLDRFRVPVAHPIRASNVGAAARWADRNRPALSSASTASSRIGWYAWKTWGTPGVMLRMIST